MNTTKKKAEESFEKKHKEDIKIFLGKKKKKDEKRLDAVKKIFMKKKN